MNNDVYRDYKDKFLSADDMNVDISTVDIFSYARHGRINQLKQVLEFGIDPNSKDKYGNTLLIIGA